MPPIRASTPTDGRSLRMIPDLTSAYCRIRVSAVEMQGRLHSVSGHPCTIRPAAPGRAMYARAAAAWSDATRPQRQIRTFVSKVLRG